MSGTAVIRVRDPVVGVIATGTVVRVDACRLPTHIPGHSVRFNGGTGVIESAFVETLHWKALCYAVSLENNALQVFPADDVHVEEKSSLSTRSIHFRRVFERMDVCLDRRGFE